MLECTLNEQLLAWSAFAYILLINVTTAVKMKIRSQMICYTETRNDKFVFIAF